MPNPIQINNCMLRPKCRQPYIHNNNTQELSPKPVRSPPVPPPRTHTSPALTPRNNQHQNVIITDTEKQQNLSDWYYIKTGPKSPLPPPRPDKKPNGIRMGITAKSLPPKTPNGFNSMNNQKFSGNSHFDYTQNDDNYNSPFRNYKNMQITAPTINNNEDISKQYPANGSINSNNNGSSNHTMNNSGGVGDNECKFNLNSTNGTVDDISQWQQQKQQLLLNIQQQQHRYRQQKMQTNVLNIEQQQHAHYDKLHDTRRVQQHQMQESAALDGRIEYTKKYQPQQHTYSKLLNEQTKSNNSINNTAAVMALSRQKAAPLPPRFGEVSSSSFEHVNVSSFPLENTIPDKPFKSTSQFPNEKNTVSFSMQPSPVIASQQRRRAPPLPPTPSPPPPHALTQISMEPSEHQTVSTFCFNPKIFFSSSPMHFFIVFVLL